MLHHCGACLTVKLLPGESQRSPVTHVRCYYEGQESVASNIESTNSVQNGKDSK